LHLGWWNKGLAVRVHEVLIDLGQDYDPPSQYTIVGHQEIFLRLLDKI
jgi:hypothetical protein